MRVTHLPYVIVICRGVEENVGNVFYQLAQLYSLHIIDLEESSKALTDCAQKNESFKAVLDDFEVIHLA